MLEAGYRKSEIAMTIGVSKITGTREVRRNTARVPATGQALP
ncbi:hypothetical protein [Tenuifilum osseticum]